MNGVLAYRQARKVRAASTQATGLLVGSPCVLRGLHYNDTSGGTAGTVVFKDGGSGGAAVLTIHTPGGGAEQDIAIPGGGMDFKTSLYVELSNVDAVTAFYYR